MNPNRLQQAVFIFFGGTVLCCICSGRWLLGGEMNIINALASFNTIQVQTAGLWAIPKGLITFFSALITALGWNYPFLSSPWALFIKFPLWLISIGAVFGILEAAKSAVQGTVSIIRGIG